jgi:hypothetical protein
MKPSTLPSVSRQISGAVVFTWAWRLATLSNWLAQIAPLGSDAAICSARSPRKPHIVVGIAVGRGRHLDQFGTEQAQCVLLFLALGFGNDDHRLVAERAGDHRQSDSGVAGSSLDDRAAGTQQALSLGVADDLQRCAVLDRLAGIEELGLAENGAAGGFRRRPERMRGVLPMASRTDLMAGMVFPDNGCLCTGWARLSSQFWLLKAFVARHRHSGCSGIRENLPSIGKNEKWHVPVIHIVPVGVRKVNRSTMERR